RRAQVLLAGSRRVAVSPRRRVPLKLRAGFELLIARVHLGAGQRTEAVHAEFFAAETAHYGAVDDGATQIEEIDVAVTRINPARRKIADEPAGEAVARARGVEHIIEQVAGHHEVAVAPEQDRAVLAALDAAGM